VKIQKLMIKSLFGGELGENPSKFKES